MSHTGLCIDVTFKKTLATVSFHVHRLLYEKQQLLQNAVVGVWNRSHGE